MNSYISTAALYYPNDQYLAHHGIKGQRWGVRRYQNEDGSLTAAGEKRYYGSANAVQRDIDSLRANKRLPGVRKEDRSEAIRGLEAARDRLRSKGDAKRQRDAAKIEYKNARKQLASRYAETDAEFDKKRDKNIYGFDSGSVKDRAKNHIKNEYERSKALNKIDQQKLDAKRQYRQQLGKKKVDTFMMKLAQQGINEVSNQSIEDFTKDYILSVGTAVLSAATTRPYNYDYN